MLLVLSKGSLIFSTWKFSQAFCLFFLGYCVARLKGNALDVLFDCKSILILKERTSHANILHYLWLMQILASYIRGKKQLIEQ